MRTLVITLAVAAVFRNSFFLQVNATALTSPLSTDVTLVSHKVEFSEDSSFASGESIGALQVQFIRRSLTPALECSIEGFTPIAGQFPRAPLSPISHSSTCCFRQYDKREPRNGSCADGLQRADTGSFLLCANILRLPFSCQRQ